MTTSGLAGRVVDEVRTLVAARGDQWTLRRLMPTAIGAAGRAES